MKKITFFLIALFTLAAFSCSGDKKSQDTTADDVKKEVREAAETAGEFAEDKMDDLAAQYGKVADSVNKEVTTLRTRYEDLNDDVREKYKERVENMEKKARELDAKVRELEKAGEQEKEELKAELDELKTALDKSIKTFRNELDSEE